MDERHRNVLQQCSEFLINNIRPELVVDRLHACHILTEDDLDRLRHEATTNDKNRLLLSLLPRTGSKAFSTLVTALNNTDQSFIADHLLAQFSKGMTSWLIKQVSGYYSSSVDLLWHVSDPSPLINSI